MLGIKLERGSAPIWLRGLIPILAIVLTFALVSILIVFAGANPLDAINQLLIIPLTKTTARGDIIVMATPLLLTGVAVAFAFVSDGLFYPACVCTKAHGLRTRYGEASFLVSNFAPSGCGCR